MPQNKFDQLWDPSPLARIGGSVQGGSAKTPREQAEMNREHEGRDDRKPPEGALPPQEPAPRQVHPGQEHPRQEDAPQKDWPAQKHPQQERVEDRERKSGED